MKSKIERALDNKCPSCGASIIYNPKLKKWKCDYCGESFDLNQLRKQNNEEVVENNQYVKYHCQDCGAEIVADEQTAATFCIYCGNTAILKSKLTGEFKPAKLIPFKNDKELAISSFKALSKGRPFMPRTFNNEENIEKIRGIYIPFWLYDFNESGSIVVDAKKVTSWTSGDRHYTKTDSYKAFRSAIMDYYRIPVDGSTRFDNDIMNTIEPFDYNELIEYNYAYLSGFLAEKYDVNSTEAMESAKVRAEASTVAKMQADVRGYTSTIVVEKNIDINQLKAEYVMLPVWMVNVKYKDKYYIFAMNGQTGEFVGNIPIDKMRVFLYAISIFVAVFLLIILISYVIYMVGE